MFILVVERNSIGSQAICILFVKQAVREAAGLSVQWPFTSVMLVMPVFLLLSAPQ